MKMFQNFDRIAFLNAKEMLICFDMEIFYKSLFSSIKYQFLQKVLHEYFISLSDSLCIIDEEEEALKKISPNDDC